MVLVPVARLRRRDTFAVRLALVALAAVAVRVAYVVALGHRLDHGFDAFWFHSMALNLVDGHGYRSIVTPAQGATAQWPPGFPAMLAAGSWFGGRTMLDRKSVV